MNNMCQFWFYFTGGKIDKINSLGLHLDADLKKKKRNKIKLACRFQNANLKPWADYCKVLFLFMLFYFIFFRPVTYSILGFY